MIRKVRDFLSRVYNERQRLADNTWCDVCGEANMGLEKPVEYEENNKFFLEGKCRKGGAKIVSEIPEIEKKEKGRVFCMYASNKSFNLIGAKSAPPG